MPAVTGTGWAPSLTTTRKRSTPSSSLIARSNSGRAVASAVDAMARQPGAAARIQTAMIIGLALIESLAIYTLVIALILLFVKGINFA